MTEHIEEPSEDHEDEHKENHVEVASHPVLLLLSVFSFLVLMALGLGLHTQNTHHSDQQSAGH